MRFFLFFFIKILARLCISSFFLTAIEIVSSFYLCLYSYHYLIDNCIAVRTRVMSRSMRELRKFVRLYRSYVDDDERFISSKLVIH